MMWSKVRKFFTGYKAKDLIIRGIPVRVTYSGRFEKINPLKPLSHLKDVWQTEAKLAETNFNIESLWNRKVSLLSDLTPTSRAKFVVEGQSIVLERYVTKSDKISISLYTFASSNTLFAVFCRNYDYGQKFDKTIQEIDGLSALIGEERLKIQLLENAGFSMLINRFGHSETFICIDKGKLKLCLESLG